MPDWIGPVVLAIGSTLVAAFPLALGLFKRFGEKWVEDRFTKRLEEMRQTHTSQLAAARQVHETELERIRHTIQVSFSRVKMLHEKEFEVLPKAWFLAPGSARRRLQRYGSYGDETVNSSRF